MDNVATNIKRLKDMYDLTQREFGDIAGVSNTTIHNWENNTAVPRRRNLIKIANHYGFSVEEFYKEPEEFMFGLFCGSDVGKLDYANSRTVDIDAYESVKADFEIGSYHKDGSLVIPASVAQDHTHSILLRVNDDGINKLAHKGDYALIDLESFAKSGSVCAVCVDDSDAVMRKVHFLNDGIVLEKCSFNEHEEPEVVMFSNGNKVKVIGQVVWSMKPYDYYLNF